MYFLKTCGQEEIWKANSKNVNDNESRYNNSCVMTEMWYCICKWEKIREKDFTHKDKDLVKKRWVKHTHLFLELQISDAVQWLI